MYSFSKIQITEEHIRAIMRRHFSSNPPLKKYTELKEGLYNAAALLELEDGSKYVLKAAPPPEVQVLRYEKDLMKAEVESMRLVRQRTTVPVAEIFCYDTAHDILPSDFFVMQYLPGIPFHQIRSSLPPESQEKIEYEMGRMTREISEITNPSFGYWACPQAEGVSWKECFSSMVQGILQDGLDVDVQLPESYEEIFNRMQAIFDSLEEISTPRLVHWDLWDGNVLIDPDSHQINGLIDFERVLWADPLIEVVFSNLNPDSPAAQGFGGNVLRTEPERRRRLLYNTYLYLIMVIEVYYRRYENDWQINWATERLKEHLVYLQEAGARNN